MLVVAEGSRTNITWLPRDEAVLARPALVAGATRRRRSPPTPRSARSSSRRPTAERPPTIRNLADLPLDEGREGRLAYATRDVRDMGSRRLVLAQDAMPPDTHNTDLHFHSAREEAGSCAAGAGSLGSATTRHELRPGSFWLRRENTGVGHRIEVGPEGMDLVTMGDLIPGDVVVYPEKRTFKPARGVELPY